MKDSQTLLSMGGPAQTNRGAVKMKTCCIQGFAQLQHKPLEALKTHLSFALDY